MLNLDGDRFGGFKIPKVFWTVGGACFEGEDDFLSLLSMSLGDGLVANRSPLQLYPPQSRLNGIPFYCLIKSLIPCIILLFSKPNRWGKMPVFLLSPRIKFLCYYDSLRIFFICLYFSLLIISGLTYSFSCFSIWIVVTLIPVSYQIIILNSEIKNYFEVKESVWRNHVM